MAAVFENPSIQKSAPDTILRPEQINSANKKLIDEALANSQSQRFTSYSTYHNGMRPYSSYFHNGFCSWTFHVYDRTQIVFYEPKYFARGRGDEEEILVKGFTFQCGSERAYKEGRSKFSVKCATSAAAKELIDLLTTANIPCANRCTIDNCVSISCPMLELNLNQFFEIIDRFSTKNPKQKGYICQTVKSELIKDLYLESFFGEGWYERRGFLDNFITIKENNEIDFKNHIRQNHINGMSVACFELLYRIALERDMLYLAGLQFIEEAKPIFKHRNRAVECVLKLFSGIPKGHRDYQSAQDEIGKITLNPASHIGWVPAYDSLKHRTPVSQGSVASLHCGSDSQVQVKAIECSSK